MHQMMKDGKSVDASDVVAKHAKHDGYEGQAETDCLFGTPEYEFYTKPDVKCKFYREVRFLTIYQQWIRH